MALYGGTQATKQYFVDRIKHYQSLGKTVKEMIEAESKKGQEKPTKAPEKKEKPSVFGLADGLYEFGSWREANEYTGLPYVTASILESKRTKNGIVLSWDTFNGRSFRLCMIYGKTAGWKE